MYTQPFLPGILSACRLWFRVVWCSCFLHFATGLSPRPLLFPNLSANYSPQTPSPRLFPNLENYDLSDDSPPRGRMIIDWQPATDTDREVIFQWNAICDVAVHMG